MTLLFPHVRKQMPTHRWRSRNMALGMEPGDEDPHVKADMDTARKIGRVLEYHYKAYPWLVHVSSKQGLASISLPILMDGAAYHIKLHDLNSDPGMVSVVRGAGEILERYRIPRSGFSGADFVAALRRNPIRTSHVPE